uniref:Uncharacterized protein n=1 Tax=Romanomermis culicivorax TaxID=13658 RepID=A0A915IEW9_ROMCU
MLLVGYTVLEDIISIVNVRGRQKSTDSRDLSDGIRCSKEVQTSESKILSHAVGLPAEDDLQDGRLNEDVIELSEEEQQQEQSMEEEVKQKIRLQCEQIERQLKENMVLMNAKMEQLKHEMGF